MTRLATFLLIALAAMVAGPVHADIIRKESPYSVMETIDRLEVAIKERSLTVFARIDHAAGAKQANLELRPTLLIIFGSAAVGTPLMQAQQTMGLSLPLKALAWQDAGGKVWLGYDAPADLAKERGVPADHPAIGRITAALAAMADAAVKR